MDRSANLANGFLRFVHINSFQGRASLGMGGVLFLLPRKEDGADERVTSAPRGVNQMRVLYVSLIW